MLLRNDLQWYRYFLVRPERLQRDFTPAPAGLTKAKSFGAKGLVWAVVEDGGSWRSPISKFLSADEMNGATKALGAGVGDVLFLVADAPLVVARVLGGIRSELGQGKVVGVFGFALLLH